MNLQPPPSLCRGKAASLPMNQEIRGWYRDENATYACNLFHIHYVYLLIASRSSVEIIQNAHEEAVALFTKVLTEDEQKRIWCGNHLSMRDLLDALNTSKKVYESKPNSKARKWLSIFSSRVIHYGGIMDVLVQHHPEYVSLAWGAMKFLFLVSPIETSGI